MKPCDINARTYAPQSGTATAPEELRIAVSFPAAGGAPGPVHFGGRLSAESVAQFKPDPVRVELAIQELQRLGFVVSQRGSLTISIRGKRRTFESVFSTKLAAFKMDTGSELFSQPAVYSPPAGAPWQMNAALQGLVDDAYIQWPHIYMASRSRPQAKKAAKKAAKKGVALQGAVGPMPPPVNYHHLDVPFGVVNHLNVRPIHQAGGSGRGVRVAMIDSGFDHSHPWFTSRNLRSTVVLAPGATHRNTDPNGHGTGESANIFSIAPGVDFIGVKTDADGSPNGGASIHEGFLTALSHNPQVISVSLGYDLRVPNSYQQLTRLPNWLAALEAEIQGAVLRGIVVVFSAGNGHYSFPGMMPEVISAGGVYVDQNGGTQASDYASAFRSSIYSQRIVPDFCGLVGLQPHADYISLPIPPGCEIDRDGASHDGTTSSDGWGVFSGTSAAAPQLAGICALLLERNPGLSPSDIKSLLSRTARDVRSGRANSASDENRVGLAAGPGADSATGSGLVNAHAAWLQA